MPIKQQLSVTIQPKTNYEQRNGFTNPHSVEFWVKKSPQTKC
jgi:hypothetical protein